MGLSRRDFLKGLAAAGVITPVIAQRLLAEPEPIEPPATALGKTRSLIERVASKPPAPDATSLMISDGRVERWNTIEMMNIERDMIDVTSMSDDLQSFIPFPGPGPSTIHFTVLGTVDIELGETYEVAVYAPNMYVRCESAWITDMTMRVEYDGPTRTELVLRLNAPLEMSDR